MNKKWMLVITLVLASVLVLAACGGKADDNSNNGNSGTGNASGEVKEFTIKATNFAFEPAEIKVKKGDKVKITLENAEGMHGLAISDFNVDIQGNNSAEFVADKAGTFEMACSVMCGTGHPDMKAKLIVEE